MADRKFRARAQMPNRKEIMGLLPTIARGSVIGTFIGALPGAGGSFASFISYALESKFAKASSMFGSGALEGVAAPESANNASSGGALIPTLTLGLPGSEITALLLAGLTIHGVQAGPLMFVQEPILVNTLFAAMLFANILMFFMAFPIARVFTRFLFLPKGVLYGGILILSLVGAFSLRFSKTDVWTVLVFGVFGYFLRRYNWPQVPLVLGVVLGPLMESSFRNALLSSHRDFSIFFSRPISATFLVIAVLSYILPIIIARLRKS
jgi:putative tricarboxylic transport membrane protein